MGTVLVQYCTAEILKKRAILIYLNRLKFFRVKLNFWALQLPILSNSLKNYIYSYSVTKLLLYL